MVQAVHVLVERLEVDHPVDEPEVEVVPVRDEEHPAHRPPCRGTWARVTIDRFNHLAHQTL